MRLRKNVKNLTAAEKTAFVNAVLILKTQPSILHPGDPVLRRYDDYPEVHMNAMMANPGWAHGGPAFFPWHRELLLQFENDLQAINPAVTIPYWDWPDPASFPLTSDFLGSDGVGPQIQVQDSPFAAGGAGNWVLKVKDDPADPDFLQRQLGADPSAPSLPTADQVTNDMNSTPYGTPPFDNTSAGFRPNIELDVHNLVHRYVGGTMAKMTSTNDPVFWLHHCNIDRLWGDWQRQNPAEPAYLPQAGAPAGQNLGDNMIFSATPPPPWTDVSTPQSTINHHALGYWYSSDPAEITQVTQNISFTDVQENETVYQAIAFTVLSPASPVTLSITSLDAPFAMSPPSSMTLSPSNTPQTAQLWIKYTGTHAGDAVSGANATVSQDGTNNSWSISITANVVAQKQPIMTHMSMARTQSSMSRIDTFAQAKANFPLRSEIEAKPTVENGTGKSSMTISKRKA
jgi:tyrosinase